MARDMPPSWEGANISVPIASFDGDFAGRVLPGEGIYLAHDLAQLGITRPIPGVHEYSKVQRRIDFAALNEATAERHAIALLAEKVAFQRTSLGPRPIAGSAITTYDGIISARANGLGEDRILLKTSITSVANIWYSLWQVAGNPAAGAYTAIPTGAAPTNATVGSWSYGLSNPTSARKKYLLTWGFASSQTINMFLVHDMLVAAGGITTNSAVAQTINTTALTRYTTGAGVNAIFDVVTAPASGTQNLTLSSYTDQDGTAGLTTVAHQFSSAEVIPLYRLSPKFPTANSSVPAMQLASGDYGVRAVATATFSAAVLTGVVALVLYFPLAFVPGVASFTYVERDSTIQIDGLTELAQTSGAVLGCLNVFINAFTTISGTVTGFLRSAEG